MQTHDENEYHRNPNEYHRNPNEYHRNPNWVPQESQLSTTRIPTEYHKNPNWVPQESQLSATRIPTEYHKNPNWVPQDYWLRSPNVERNYTWKINSLEGEAQVSKSWLWPTIIANERRGNLPIEHHEIPVKCYKNWTLPICCPLTSSKVYVFLCDLLKIWTSRRASGMRSISRGRRQASACESYVLSSSLWITSGVPRGALILKLWYLENKRQ